MHSYLWFIGRDLVALADKSHLPGNQFTPRRCHEYKRPQVTMSSISRAIPLNPPSLKFPYEHNIEFNYTFNLKYHVGTKLNGRMDQPALKLTSNSAEVERHIWFVQLRRWTMNHHWSINNIKESTGRFIFITPSQLPHSYFSPGKRIFSSSTSTYKLGQKSCSW